jgi:hypothetical protein
MHPLRRSAIVCVLAPCVVLSPVVLPEHLHEADPEHPHVVVHRHFESHDHDGAEISEREGRVVWLTAAAIQPATGQLTAPPAVRPSGFNSVPPTGRAVATTLDEAAPPHGPPRSGLSLRGPPSLSL